jgi:hypothetical protein
LLAVVDTSIPGGIAASTSFEFGAGKEGESEVNIFFPEELILLLCNEVFARGFRRGRVKPAWNVCT